MADQIKNENLGEVSSPTPEKTAPTRKEPVFAEPPKRRDPSFGPEDGEDMGGNLPEKNLPSFKGENGGAGDDKPARKEPVFKSKERKLPLFSSEVKQHPDDEESEEVDFTSDSLSMPIMAAGATTGIDASEIVESKRKKRRKARKEKADSIAELEAKADNLKFNSMDQFDELSLMGGTMPSVVPFGGEGYLDLGNSAGMPYVPEYEEENAIMAKKQSKDKVAEPEPMPENSPFEASAPAEKSEDSGKAPEKKEKTTDPGVEEAKSLIEDSNSEKKSSE